MKIGIAKVDITPPVGSPLAGYSNRTSFSTGVHDELYARALVLDNGTTRAALVSCDLIGVLGETTDAVRERGINAGIPGENIMVCAYHTHSGPTPDLGYGEMGEYMKSLSDGISSAVMNASLGIEEVRFKHASARAEGFTVNRRDPKNGPIDSELITLSWESGASARGFLVNFSCHAVVLGPDNTLISADYPGYLMSRMEDCGATCLFTNGACGDINPLTDSLRNRMFRGEDIYDRRGGTFEEAEALGTSLSRLAIESLGTSEPLNNDRLVVATKTFDAPFHPMVPMDALEVRIEELQTMLAAMQDGCSTPDELYRTGLELEF
ncbi:MAG: neutral/alkaline non-lysosomal ceramidase N-terminal domain-containing protein, partial [Theionarchaea archaeon]|nr:neutral/alkaline non-lysosomal ceramidase N-terminal domain-containing protein [Theionarchaea archaeon]